jgi:hypothetical protein
MVPVSPVGAPTYTYDHYGPCTVCNGVGFHFRDLTPVEHAEELHAQGAERFKVELVLEQLPVEEAERVRERLYPRQSGSRKPWWRLWGRQQP